MVLQAKVGGNIMTEDFQALIPSQWWKLSCNYPAWGKQKTWKMH